jgi:hypothetical protein
VYSTDMGPAASRLKVNGRVLIFATNAPLRAEFGSDCFQEVVLVQAIHRLLRADGRQFLPWDVKGWFRFRASCVACVPRLTDEKRDEAEPAGDKACRQ